jgi:hypothetical protein
MNECERKDFCIFFSNKLMSMPSIGKRLKEDYCQKNKNACARYMIHQKLMQGYAPADELSMLKISKEMQALYPNDTERAERVIDWLVKS